MSEELHVVAQAVYALFGGDDTQCDATERASVKGEEREEVLSKFYPKLKIFPIKVVKKRGAQLFMAPCV